jgi:inosine-uridine nucleoside N-ribohydrolase
MGNDVDDALALALAHSLEWRGACRLLAVTLTNPDPLAGVYVDALNRFYGRPGIPIGISPDAPRVSASRFLSVAQATDPATGDRLYPSGHDARTAPRSLDVLRRTLADAQDNSVVIVQIGFFTNLAALLDSPPDAASPLAGTGLVKRKVRFLSLMAGAFLPVDGNEHRLEFNVRHAIPAAQRVVADWPTPAVWSGWEVGNAIRFPASAIDHGYAWATRHILPESYQAFEPTPHERPTYDLTSVLHAVWPEHSHFNLSEPGRVIVENDGFTRLAHAPTGEGRDRILSVTPIQAARLRGLFEALCTEPSPV